MASKRKKNGPTVTTRKLDPPRWEMHEIVADSKRNEFVVTAVSKDTLNITLTSGDPNRGGTQRVFHIADALGEYRHIGYVDHRVSMATKPTPTPTPKPPTEWVEINPKPKAHEGNPQNLPSLVKDLGGHVDHPKHYNMIPGIECVDVVERMPWNTGTAMKYLWRCGHKGGDIETLRDLHKAIWYTKRQIKLLGGDPEKAP